MSEKAYTLYGDRTSGNCYKPALLLSLLGIDYNWVEIPVLSGRTRQPPFLVKNPNGRVPLLEWADGRVLVESNAILLHLAEGTPYLPGDAYLRALVYQWLFFEQYSHEPYVAVRRFLLQYDHGMEPDPARLAMLKDRGDQALGVMDRVLAGQAFIAGEQYSIADIALFAYTHVADTGGFELSNFPAVTRWLDRVREQPGHFDMFHFSP
ncbi:MAG: glutathione S-transferase family protein [Xanthomonadales bacterium]|nr:glutathione S-transferase family protein [Xanthomonadales bacterium]